MTKTCAFALLVVAAPLGAARAADPDLVLRLATIAPDGTAWARELKALGRSVEAATSGHLKIKWYFGGIGGDELEQGERIRKGQLDGSLSGQMLCERAAPSMRLMRLPGVFQTRDEAEAVMDRLLPTIVEEAHQKSFVIPNTTGMGPDVIFTRTPVHNMAELRKLKLWRWDLDEVGIATSRAMGLSIVPLKLSEAARAYDEGRVDGFLAIPAAALAFQWSAQARYVTDLRSSYIWGCLVVSERSFAKLPVGYQQALVEATARARLRIADIARRTDEQLLGGLFQKQGSTPVPPSPSFRAEFFAAARAAREVEAEKFIPRALLSRALQMLADYRAEHPEGTAKR